MTDAMPQTTALSTALRILNLILQQHFPLFVVKMPAIPMINSRSSTRLRQTILIRHHYLHKSIADSLFKMR